MSGDSPVSIPGLDLLGSANEDSPNPIPSPTSMPGPDSQSSGDENSSSSTSQGNSPTSPGPDSADENPPNSTPQLELKRKLSPVSESSRPSKRDRMTDSRAESAVGSPKLEDVPSHPGNKSSPSATRVGSPVVSLGDVPPHQGKKSLSPSAKDLDTIPLATESSKHLDIDTLPQATTPDSLPSPAVSDLSEVSHLLEDDEEAVAAPEDEHSSVYEDVPVPKAPVYDPSLQRGLNDVRKQLSRLADMMQLSDLTIDQGSILKELRPEAEKLSKFTYPESRTVGFIGTSGEGMLERFLANSF